MFKLNQKGVVPVFVLIAGLGLLAFFFLSSAAPFKDKLFAQLFPKPPSYAAGSTDTSYNLAVLVIKYFPLTADGQNIDITVTGDVGDPYSTIRQRTSDVTNNLKSALEKASRYLGYKDATALPSLTYQILDTKEYTQAVPILTDGTRRPNYNGIMTTQNICDYVDNKNVREVWLWAYQGPTYPGSTYPYLNISESKMAGPFGDISNSWRSNDMPVCKNTYRVYTFNYGRGTAEAMESWGHQIEAESDAVDRTLFRDKFQGPNYPQTLSVNGRCGSVHNPPNARYEYDRGNPTPQKSDCLDWNPESMGVLSDISCANWGCVEYGDNNNPSLNYMIWNWQNLPGRNNTKTYQGKQFRNWWDVHGDFDKVMGNDRTLFVTTPLPPLTVLVSDNFDRANSLTLNNTTTGQAWSAIKGGWGISASQAYSVDGCPAPGYALIDSGSKNGYVQVSIPVNRQDVRIPFRVQDLNNLYWVENVGSFYTIDKMVAGSRTRLAQTSGITPADGDTVKIELNDSKITVYINGVSKISFDDNAISGTQHGIGTWCNGDIRYDNFSIAVPTSSLPTPTPTPIFTPTPTPTPTSSPQAPVCDDSQLNMSVSPNPSKIGDKVTFSLSGSQGSTWIGDSWSGGVDCSGSFWGSKTCTAIASGNFSWTHTWQNTAPNNFDIKSSQCNKTMNFAVQAVVTPTPTPSDTQAPKVSLVHPPNGAIIKINTKIPLNATASDNVAVAKVEFYVAGSLKCIMLAPNSLGQYSCSWFMPNLPGVTYSITAKAYDAAGNNASSSVSVTSKL